MVLPFSHCSFAFSSFPFVPRNKGSLGIRYSFLCCLLHGMVASGRFSPRLVSERYQDIERIRKTVCWGLLFVYSLVIPSGTWRSPTTHVLVSGLSFVVFVFCLVSAVIPCRRRHLLLLPLLLSSFWHCYPKRFVGFLPPGE